MADTREITREQAEAAARWWADQFRGLPKYDNGDDSAQGGVAFAMATLVAVQVPDANEEQLDKFVDILATVLTGETYPYLGCDYGPGKRLADAMQEAGIDTGRAPWKTNMSIRDGKVSVSAGYGAPYEVIWTADEEVHRA